MPNFQFNSGEEYIFNPELLKGLDWEPIRHCLSPYITNEDPGEPWLIVRPLKLSDYDQGFLQILSQLTSVGNVSRTTFESKYNNYASNKIMFFLFY